MATRVAPTKARETEPAWQKESRDVAVLRLARPLHTAATAQWVTQAAYLANRTAVATEEVHLLRRKARLVRDFITQHVTEQEVARHVISPLLPAEWDVYDRVSARANVRFQRFRIAVRAGVAGQTPTRRAEVKRTWRQTVQKQLEDAQRQAKERAKNDFDDQGYDSGYYYDDGRAGEEEEEEEEEGEGDDSGGAAEAPAVPRTRREATFEHLARVAGAIFREKKNTIDLGPWDEEFQQITRGLSADHARCATDTPPIWQLRKWLEVRRRQAETQLRTLGESVRDQLSFHAAARRLLDLLRSVSISTVVVVLRAPLTVYAVGTLSAGAIATLFGAASVPAWAAALGVGASGVVVELVLTFSSWAHRFFVHGETPSWSRDVRRAVLAGALGGATAYVNMNVKRWVKFIPSEFGQTAVRFVVGSALPIFLNSAVGLWVNALGPGPSRIGPVAEARAALRPRLRRADQVHAQLAQIHWYRAQNAWWRRLRQSFTAAGVLGALQGLAVRSLTVVTGLGLAWGATYALNGAVGASLDAARARFFASEGDDGLSSQLQPFVAGLGVRVAYTALGVIPLVDKAVRATVERVGRLIDRLVYAIPPLRAVFGPFVRSEAVRQFTGMLAYALLTGPVTNLFVQPTVNAVQGAEDRRAQTALEAQLRRLSAQSDVAEETRALLNEDVERSAALFDDVKRAGHTARMFGSIGYDAFVNRGKPALLLEAARRETLLWASSVAALRPWMTGAQANEGALWLLGGRNYLGTAASDVKATMRQLAKSMALLENHTSAVRTQLDIADAVVAARGSPPAAQASGGSAPPEGDSGEERPEERVAAYADALRAQLKDLRGLGVAGRQLQAAAQERFRGGGGNDDWQAAADGTAPLDLSQEPWTFYTGQFASWSAKARAGLTATHGLFAQNEATRAASDNALEKHIQSYADAFATNVAEGAARQAVVSPASDTAARLADDLVNDLDATLAPETQAAHGDGDGDGGGPERWIVLLQHFRDRVKERLPVAEAQALAEQATRLAAAAAANAQAFHRSSPRLQAALDRTGAAAAQILESPEARDRLAKALSYDVVRSRVFTSAVTSRFGRAAGQLLLDGLNRSTATQRPSPAAVHRFREAQNIVATDRVWSRTEPVPADARSNLPRNGYASGDRTLYNNEGVTQTNEHRDLQARYNAAYQAWRGTGPVPGDVRSILPPGAGEGPYVTSSTKPYAVAGMTQTADHRARMHWETAWKMTPGQEEAPADAQTTLRGGAAAYVVPPDTAFLHGAVDATTQLSGHRVAQSPSPLQHPDIPLPQGTFAPTLAASQQDEDTGQKDEQPALEPAARPLPPQGRYTASAPSAVRRPEAPPEATEQPTWTTAAEHVLAARHEVEQATLLAFNNDESLRHMVAKIDPALLPGISQQLGLSEETVQTLAEASEIMHLDLDQLEDVHDAVGADDGTGADDGEDNLSKLLRNLRGQNFGRRLKRSMEETKDQLNAKFPEMGQCISEPDHPECLYNTPGYALLQAGATAVLPGHGLLQKTTQAAAYYVYKHNFNSQGVNARELLPSRLRNVGLFNPYHAVADSLLGNPRVLEFFTSVQQSSDSWLAPVYTAYHVTTAVPRIVGMKRLLQMATTGNV